MSNCKVLVANRGEIAIRVLRAAAELGWNTVAIYTDKDESHVTFAGEAVKLDDVTDYMDVPKIVGIAQRFECSHLHPGYGFLSESPALASALPPSILFIGPDVNTLRIASDKLLSRDLAASLSINVAPGSSVSSVDDVYTFARVQGLPLMIKALDGGGGRGIRIVRCTEEVEEAFNRCMGESPSRQIFVEQALTGPFWKHIEVQIVGDGSDAVTHLWERECSVQRRFQKVVEIAPSRLPPSVINVLLEASMKMASQLKYKGLGTFEYLVNAQTMDWVFLEINPRVQVEHTVTEEITGIDLVRTQLLLFSSSPTLKSLSLLTPPSLTSHAIQLRLTAEDPLHSFRLSSGSLKPGDVVWPSGPSVRIDTWLLDGPFSRNESPVWTVSPEFDSLLAKVIVRGHTFSEATQKARRALSELRVGGGLSNTNRSLLLGILSHPDWLLDRIDTLWLERNLSQVLDSGNTISVRFSDGLRQSQPTFSASQPVQPTLQPGTLFHLTLAPSNNTTLLPMKHNLTLSSISENAFPSRLSGVLQTSLSTTPLTFTLSQSTSAAIQLSDFELANPGDEAHVAAPLTGKIVELHPALQAASLKDKNIEANSFIKKGETMMVLSVMKMESAVVAPHDGFVERVGKGIRTGVVLGESMLVCVLGPAATSKL